MKQVGILFAVLLLLTSCATSVWNPNKTYKSVKVGGYSIDVMHIEGNKYTARYISFGFLTDPLGLSQSEVKAIEQVTGCKVIDHINVPDSTYVQAEVKCK